MWIPTPYVTILFYLLKVALRQMHCCLLLDLLYVLGQVMKLSLRLHILCQVACVLIVRNQNLFCVVLLRRINTYGHSRVLVDIHWTLSFT